MKLKLKLAPKRPVEGAYVETGPGTGAFLNRKTAATHPQGREALEKEQARLEAPGFILKEQDIPFELLSRAQLIDQARKAGATQKELTAINVANARNLVRKLVYGWVPNEKGEYEPRKKGKLRLVPAMKTETFAEFDVIAASKGKPAWTIKRKLVLR